MDFREEQRWRQVVWPGLRRLRHVFLHEPESAAGGSYWTPRLLKDYDLVLGERIRWKWNAVLEELVARGWTPPGDSLHDWGCGPGVAARAVAAHWPQALRVVRFSDRSELAVEYAGENLRREHPELRVGPAGPAPLLVVSHVLNELPEGAEQELLERLSSATAVIWVEPGTREHSRRLVRIRERLRGVFQAVAPCTHDEPCGLLAPEAERHWCHHFARPPRPVFHHAGWSRAAKELGLDIGVVPYSYLVLDKRPPPPPREGWSRRLGHARLYKGVSKVLDCSAAGLRECSVLQRMDRRYFHDLKKHRVPSLQAWRWQNGRIVGVEVFPPPAPEEGPAGQGELPADE
jgi:hypothetical protein